MPEEWKLQFGNDYPHVADAMANILFPQANDKLLSNNFCLVTTEPTTDFCPTTPVWWQRRRRHKSCCEYKQNPIPATEAKTLLPMKISSDNNTQNTSENISKTPTPTTKATGTKAKDESSGKESNNNNSDGDGDEAAATKANPLMPRARTSADEYTSKSEKRKA